MSTRADVSRRSSVARLVVVVVVAAVLVGVGVVIGRQTAPATPPRAAAPDGQPAQTVAGPGPARVDGGVPVGYAHSEEGAVAAASQYATTLGSAAMLDARSRATVFDRIGIAEARDDLARLADTADLFAEQLGISDELVDEPGFVYSTYPAGWRVRAYSDQEAVVDVWSTGLFMASGREAFMSPWNTATFTLRWSDGDWRVAALETTDGPTPPVGQVTQNTAAGAQINDFNAYWYVPAR